MRQYLAAGAHGWGRADTEEEAIRIMKERIPSHLKRKKGFEAEGILFEVPEGSWMDQMGYIHWEDDDPDGVKTVRELTIKRTNRGLEVR